MQGNVPAAGATPGGWPADWQAKWQEWQSKLQNGAQNQTVPAFGSPFGQQPQPGLLGEDAQARLLAAAEQQKATGQAAALPARPQQGPLGGPEVIATLLVALVGGLLVRTWSVRPARR